MIIFRYIAKEVVQTVVATTAVLVLIFMSTQFVRYLSDAAMGQLTGSILIHIMLLQIPHLLGLLMPVGLFLALLLALGRLYADREMTVLFSSGLSKAKLIGMAMILGVIVAVIVAILTVWLSPIIAKDQQRLIKQAEEAPLVDTIQPEKFYSPNHGNWVFYSQNVSRDHQKLANIFVGQHTTSNKTNQWNIVSANHGYQEVDPKTGARYIVISDGYRYQGQPGQNNFEIAKFKKYSMRIQEPHLVLKKEPKTMSMSELWQIGNANPKAAAEFQWRISMPLSVLILTLLAIPLSQVNPRQGKYAQLLPSVLIYILYANMMFVNRAWIQSGTIPPALGVWWLHGLLLLLALVLLGIRSGWIPLLINQYRYRHAAS